MRKDLFDLRPYYPALALIRIPRDLSQEREPAADAEFGSAFFVQTEGGQSLLLTARHNLLAGKEHEPWVERGKLLPWVWVCCYEKSTGDWTDCYRVEVDRKLTDKSCDAALLQMPNYEPAKTLPLAYDWRRGDDVIVIGFQPRPSRAGSGFWPLWCTCYIPPSPVDVQPIEGVQEPFLGLRFTPQSELLLPIAEGISGGPVIDLRYKPPHVIAVEKAIMPGERLRPAYPLSILLRWFEPLFKKLPQEYQPIIRPDIREIVRRIWLWFISLGRLGKSMIVLGILLGILVLCTVFSTSWVSADRLACYIPYGFGGVKHPKALEIELVNNSTEKAVINASLVLKCAATPSSPVEVKVIGNAVVGGPLNRSLEPGSSVSIPVVLERGERKVVRLEAIGGGGWIGWDFWELKGDESSIGRIGREDNSYMEFKGSSGQEKLPNEYKLRCNVNEGAKGLELRCKKSALEIILKDCR